MAIPVWGGVRFGPLGTRIKRILDELLSGVSGIYITSAYRPGDGGYHGGYAGGAAVDIGFGYGSSGYQARARRAAQPLYNSSSRLRELIVSYVGGPGWSGGYYVKNGSRVGGYAVADHANHIHVAMSLSDVKWWEAQLKKKSPSKPTPSKPSSGEGKHHGASQHRTSRMRWYHRPTARRGDSGGVVGHVQYLLRERQGYKIDKLPTRPFGPQTEAAVKAFQRKYKHLKADGVVGPKTWAQLEVAAAKAIAPAKRPTLKRGASGMWVGFAQHALRKAGQKVDDLDGFPFGPQTERAVKAVQNKYLPSVTRKGTIGKQTWEVLDALEAGRTPGKDETPAPAPEPKPESKYDNKVRPIPGWDASNYDQDRGMKTSHLAAAYKEGMRFFTHKLTEGTRFTHNAGPYVKAAVSAGFKLVGVYVVVRTPGNNGNGSIAQQADHFMVQLNKQWPQWKSFEGFFVQIDTEKWGYDNTPPKYGAELAKAIRSRIGGNKPVGFTPHYAPRWAYANTIPGSEPLWASNYTGSGGPANWKTQWNKTPKMSHAGWGAYSGRKPRILQYASDATIGGQGTCDANMFDGTEQDFAKMIGAL